MLQQESPQGLELELCRLCRGGCIDIPLINALSWTTPLDHDIMYRTSPVLWWGEWPMTHNTSRECWLSHLYLRSILARHEGLTVSAMLICALASSCCNHHDKYDKVMLHDGQCPHHTFKLFPMCWTQVVSESSCMTSAQKMLDAQLWGSDSKLVFAGPWVLLRLSCSKTWGARLKSNSAAEATGMAKQQGRWRNLSPQSWVYIHVVQLNQKLGTEKVPQRNCVTKILPNVRVNFLARFASKPLCYWEMTGNPLEMFRKFFGAVRAIFWLCGSFLAPEKGESNAPLHSKPQGS